MVGAAQPVPARGKEGRRPLSPGPQEGTASSDRWGAGGRGAAQRSVWKMTVRQS